MITLSQFKTLIENEWLGYFPDEYIGMQVQFVKDNDVNGKTIAGVALKGKENVSPVLYFGTYYERIRKGEFAGNVLNEMAEKYMEFERTMPNVSKEIKAHDILDFEKVKAKITFVLVNRNKNEELLGNVSYAVFEDLAKVFYVQINEDMRAKVSKDLCSVWQKTPMQLDKIAIENMKQLSPPQLWKVSDYVFYGSAENRVESNEPIDELYALSNENHSYGAAAMFYPGIIENISERVGKSFYILPSSIHETLILPKHDEMNLQDVKRIVRDVNRSSVEEKDFLSDNVYFFDGRTKEIKMMREDFDRIQDKKQRKHEVHER